MAEEIIDNDFIELNSEEVEKRLASQTQRFITYLIDIGVYIAISVMLVTLKKSPAGSVNWEGVLIFTAYYWAMEHYMGQTLGKMVTKTRVVMENGQRPEGLNILGRTLARLIPFEALSFLFSPVGLHDRLSRTRVIDLSSLGQELPT